MSFFLIIVFVFLCKLMYIDHYVELKKERKNITIVILSKRFHLSATSILPARLFAEKRRSQGSLAAGFYKLH